jgi:hypothetical protein
MKLILACTLLFPLIISSPAIALNNDVTNTVAETSTQPATAPDATTKPATVVPDAPNQAVTAVAPDAATKPATVVPDAPNQPITAVAPDDATKPATVVPEAQTPVVSKDAPSSTSSDKPEKSLSSIDKNKLNFTLEDCHKDGEDVTCDLRFTNMDSKDQNISLHADCSRIIDGDKEFGGFVAQIGQSSSADLSAGVFKKGFIKFHNFKANTDKAKILEISYKTADNEGTVRFEDVEIQ